MRAIICGKYGPPDVLELKEAPKPAPKPNELLIRVRATTVTSGDCRIRGFRSPPLFWLPMRLILGVRRPRNPILGVELAGEVEAVGRNVKRFKPGDSVFAMTGFKMGAYAEYACVRETGVVAPMPANATYEEAVALSFGGTTALHFFRKARLRAGQKALVYGASGSVGTSAVLLAKAFGAEVTAVCSGANAELVKSLGADKVVDYTREDFTRTKERYDVVFDAVGRTTKSAGRKVLAKDGQYITVEGQGVAKELPEDLLLLKDLYESGKIKAVIDRRYPLERMAEAHAYVDGGRKKGNVVITV
ncbi:NAD(P)-dependent alcohol dehydrogenase [Cohnella sp. CIP 111063]|uniref:NAD(P)-dependent alcohol dehydrogenase n=1 Tax=unclassified Cohnella TaxID=2636738 RepID=UPI000B8BF062|nr:MULTISPECIES: NAD(P)-dependent alcohol dehydrogenase [unclassified Cohnella]OXS59987.1 NAD(P)-dependent alcohol dehydrogenase [Cohnella sp. CIP 111063]PRX72802.1 NADPH:quinone reductase-like Zn-dependent oxidoreductase [Cohnella sp. SGD-V74]